ncbi:MAG: excinuclease ABC subunit B, partial [Flavobacteriales bacterium]|nr:excinuclease ABC subunit B [Flavobacteriales bacterium]
YIHSDIDTLERIEIMREFRLGTFDVLIGINLLREGLDLPEVSLVAILDADKEGFLRSHRSLTQTAGRAARNVNGRVIFYADKITNSMRKTMDETDRRRKIQLDYNLENNITPTAIRKSKEEIIGQTGVLEWKSKRDARYYVEPEEFDMAADPEVKYKNTDDLKADIEKIKRLMKAAAKENDFIEAARLRDEMYKLEKMLIQV